jgi:hypothetical protein
MRVWLALSAIALGAVASMDASAQGVEPVDEEAESSPYQRHMRNGVRLYRDGDFDGAIAEFEAAYRADAKASPLINLALAYKKLQDPARAVEVLEKALRLHRDSMPDDQIEAAEREIRDMKALIAYVPVVVKPADARVTVDRRPVPSVEKPLALSPGTRTFRAEAPGYRGLERTVRVVSGHDNAIVELTLEATVGEIVVTAKSETAWIEVDGKQRAQGSWRGTLPPGLHIVRVVDGDDVERVEVVVQAGAVHNVRQGDDGDLISDAAIPRDPDDPVARPFGPRDIPEILRGVYLMGGGGLLTAWAIDPSQSLAFQPDGSDRFGGAVSLHAGYRVADWAGFELYGQFSDIRVSGNVTGFDVLDPETNLVGPGTAEDVTMVLTSVRFGALMRILIPGRSRFRFVSTFGGGGAYEILRFRQRGPVPRIQGATVYDEREETGVGVWVTLDLGVELEYENVLFDLVLQHTVQTTKHFDRADQGESNAFDTKPLFVTGPVVRIGYGLW